MLYKVNDGSLDGLLSKVVDRYGYETKVDKDIPVGVLCLMGPSRSGKSFFLYFTTLYLEQLSSET